MALSDDLQEKCTQFNVLQQIYFHVAKYAKSCDEDPQKTAMMIQSLEIDPLKEELEAGGLHDRVVQTYNRWIKLCEMIIKELQEKPFQISLGGSTILTKKQMKSIILLICKASKYDNSQIVAQLDKCNVEELFTILFEAEKMFNEDKPLMHSLLLSSYIRALEEKTK
jgi:hypothetical protein